MRAASRHPKNLLIHIGPHKTGTSSIQGLLLDNAELLRKLGFYYPASPTSDGAHHHVPFALKKWNLLALGLAPVTTSGFPGIPDLQTDMESWLTGANQFSCDTVVISAEDFSSLNQREWFDFSHALVAAQAKTKIKFSQITICTTERSVSERARSLSSEYLKLGLALAAEDVDSMLKEKISTQDLLVRHIPSSFSVPVRVRRIAYSSPDSMQAFLETWVTEFLGSDVLAALPKGSLESRLNDRLNPLNQARLLKFNQLNTPASADVFTPFYVSSAEDEGRNIARLRLAMMVSVSEELQAAESNLKLAREQIIVVTAQTRIELEAAREHLEQVRRKGSWRIAKLFRMLESFLRGR